MRARVHKGEGETPSTKSEISENAVSLSGQKCGFEAAQLPEVMNVCRVEISYPHPTHTHNCFF